MDSIDLRGNQDLSLLKPPILGKEKERERGREGGVRKVLYTFSTSLSSHFEAPIYMRHKEKEGKLCGPVPAGLSDHNNSLKLMR